MNEKEKNILSRYGFWRERIVGVNIDTKNNKNGCIMYCGRRCGGCGGEGCASCG